MDLMPMSARLMAIVMTVRAKPMSLTAGSVLLMPTSTWLMAIAMKGMAGASGRQGGPGKLGLDLASRVVYGMGIMQDSSQLQEDDMGPLGEVQRALDIVRRVLALATIRAAELRKYRGKWCGDLDTFAGRAARCLTDVPFLRGYSAHFARRAADIEELRGRVSALKAVREALEGLLKELMGTLARDRARLYELADSVLRLAQLEAESPLVDTEVRLTLKKHLKLLREGRDRKNERVALGKRRAHRLATPAPAAVVPADASPEEAFLRQILAQGPVTTAAGARAARELGLAAEKVRRARQALGVKRKKLGRTWYWVPPARWPGDA